ncbi:DUF2130 domain-containing protein [Sediminibacterium roseum]|uniref:DUF2130 domain-containing protein n=1 Tax=Sediminibacterium roseum TaxID=1978412 RepID=A0ABX0A1P9_9BACT|nr:DUF2130 domain-containing protein [Sediminibacterium roseum]NCI51140.1 DUF2130 domain-containing protein [Sediminibacterium roseum]
MADYKITCPNCNTEFEPGESTRVQIENELRGKMEEWRKKKDEEFKKREQLFDQQLKAKEEETRKQIDAEKKRLKDELESSIRKSMASDFENQIQLLKQSDQEKEEKLREARKKELEFLQKEKMLQTKEEELELTLQRQLMEERERLKEQLQKDEAEKLSMKEQEFLLRLKEKDKQLEDQKKLVEEMRRKGEQGSTQLQGEVLELTLETLLKTEFSNDDIREVKKGEEGGDIIQEVRNELRKSCGVIVWETKRAKNWSDKWIDKLKEDTQKGNADIAVLVTQTVPKDVDRFGRKDGIWICCLADVKLVASILRESLIKHYETTRVLDNVSDKKETLYKYMTSNEFKQKWEAIITTYMNMQKQITKEKIRVSKDWAEREKQLQIMLHNSMGFLGDVKGIGGLEIKEINLLEEGENE